MHILLTMLLWSLLTITCSTGITPLRVSHLKLWSKQLAGRSVNFTGRYVASSPSLPIINKVQYWKMLHYSQNNGYTTAIFSRNLTVCNAAHTIAIVPGTLFVIFAWGSSFTSNSLFKDIKYHSPANRSSTSLPLTSTINQKITLNMNQIQTVDFRVNVKIS